METPPDNKPSQDRPAEPLPSDEIPAIEDAYTADDSSGETVAEDDPQLLDPAVRSLETSPGSTGEDTGEARISPDDAAVLSTDKYEASDTATIADDGTPTESVPRDGGQPDWSNETSAHKIVVELKRIESEVRQLLEVQDGKRKRKLGGTRRWLELEEDIIAWHYTGRLEEPLLHHLHDLVAKRHHLFRRLRFVAGTRPYRST